MPLTARAARLVLVVLVAAAVAAVGASVAARSTAPQRSGARHGLVRRAVMPPLSLQQMAGQRIIYAYKGPTPPGSLLAAIRAGDAAGVIFFSDNIVSAAQLHSVVDELQRARLASPVREPLLMLTDQEGGEVRRLPGAPALSEKQIGESAHAVQVAAAAGGAAARNLHSAGINVNLAPVLDVFRRPGNFIDHFQRSYSSDPLTAASLGGAFITAQQRLAVAATAKHFPGLGAAAEDQDTDVGPVTLAVPLARLRAVDEAPYRTAIATGVQLVMTSWATYPALDPRRPAGLSAAVIQGELRGRLGFTGVTITDAIDAGGIRRFGSIGERAVLAAGAGADLILCATVSSAGNSPALGFAARNALAAALAARRLQSSAFQEAVTRVLTLRAAP